MTFSEYEQIADMGMYSSADAGRFVGLNSSRVRRWLQGYSYIYESGRRHKSPLIQRPDGSKDAANYASFLDLVDLLFARRFLDYGISLQKLRKALEEASLILGTAHFARDIFFTDGKAIYLKIGKDGNNLLQLLSGGQWVIAEIILQLAKQIEFDKLTGLARRWFPDSGKGLIAIDPLVSFGRPTLIGKGIVTGNIYDFYLAENKDMNRVCEWWKLTPEEVRAAVSFEVAIAA